MNITVKINDSKFTASLERNETTDVLIEMMEQEPLVIEMQDYSGFEKVGSLKRSLPAKDSQITTKAGDIVLYQGNKIVMFYGSNSWSYTKIGKINDLTGWEEALGNRAITATFILED